MQHYSRPEPAQPVPFRKRISHIFEYLFVLFLLFTVNLIPFRSLHSVSVILVTVLKPLLKSPIRRIRENSSHYLSFSSDREEKKFITENLVHSFRASLEILQAWKFRRKKMVRKYITPAAEAVSVINSDSGVIFAEGHLGNWELPVLFFRSYDYYVHFSAKHLKNPYVDRLLHRIRSFYGGDIVYVEDSGRFLKYLRRKEPIGLVADQDASFEGIFVPFLGKEASTFSGPAMMAYLAKARLVTASCIFKGKGRYEFTVKTVAAPEDMQQFKNRDEAIKKLTLRWVQALEEEVAKAPEQYFWLHRRWKTRPPEENNGQP